MRFVLFLHIVTAVLFLGPLTVAGSTAPRYIRAGADGLPVVRYIHRTVRVYGVASLLIFGLGAALVPLSHTSFGQFWLSASMTLFVVMIGLLFGLVYRDLRRAVARLEAGGTASESAYRVAGVTGVVAICWIVILALMIYQPGS